MPTTLRHILKFLAIGLGTILTSTWCGVLDAQPTTWDWAIGNNNGNNEQVRDIAVDTVNVAVYSVGTYDDAGPFGLGSTTGGTDGFLARTDLDGNVLWSLKIGGTSDDGCNAVAVGPDGNVYVTGSFRNAMTVNILGNITVIGSGQSDLYVACYSPSGVLQWMQNGGSAGDDIGYGIAVNSTGVFVQAGYKGNALFGSITALAGLNNGHYQVVLLKYTHAGNLLWRLDGTSTNKDQYAERITSDELGVYITGTFGTNQMRWYSGSTLLATINATGDPNIYVCAVTNNGSVTWVQAVSNPGTDNINGNGIAVGCGAVYITGSVHNSSTFPSGTILNAAGNPHDYLYLAALNKTNGGTRWVRTAYSPDNHMCVGYDLTVHANGSVFLCGSYKESATFTDGTTIQTTGGGGYDKDVFLARYTSYGQLSWVTTANGSHDDVPLAIAVNKSSGIYTGGYFNDDLTFPPTAVNSSGDANLFLAKLSDEPNAYWAQNPSDWYPPSAICANAGVFDLNSTVPAFSREYVDAVVAFSGVTNQTNIIGTPNATVVAFTSEGATLTADLTNTIISGNSFTIVWGKQTAFAGTASFQVETSPDNSTWTLQTAPSSSTTSTSLVNSTIRTTAPTRYIRITKRNTLSTINFKIDAIKFFNGSVQGGTWSGVGVDPTGIFDPSALGGQTVPITYTIANGSCAYSTTHALTIAPSLVGGSITSTLSGPQCPGNNSGTLTLAGHTGNIVEWQASTDNFTSYSPLASTSPTYTFGNLTQTTSFQVKMSNGCGAVRSGAYTVQVGDNVPPIITTCPPARSIPVGTNCRTLLPDLTPEAAGTDNCSTTLTWTQSPVAGTTVTKGVQIITIKAIDGAGNSTSCTVAITVVDATAPVISGCPADVTLNADPGRCSATYTFTPPIASDNCGPVLNTITSVAMAAVDALAIQALADPDEYPIGVTTQVFKFTDASGTTSSCSFSITVVDDQAPTVVGCPADITMPSTTGLCGAVVYYPEPDFSDNCAYRIERISGPASGEVFPVGVTTVEHLATDSAGQSVVCAFNVIVEDVEAPVITGCPSNIIVQAPLAGTGATATWTAPTATDNCGIPVVTRTTGTAPGSFFTIGSHTITYTATANGLSSMCSFTVTVIGNDAPTIACPANQILFSTPAACAQVFTYPVPTVADDLPLPIGQPVQVDATGYQSGSAFPMGITAQTWRVMDSNGNSTICTFSVQVIDTIRPTFTNCPIDITLNVDPGQCGAFYSYPALVAMDNCTGPVLVTRTIGPASGALFPVGTTQVRHRATDASGHTSFCSFLVTVLDNVSPILFNCPADTSVAAEPASCGTRVVFAIPTLTDNCAATLSQTQGPASGSLFLVGDTPIEFTATDAAGNTNTCGFNVHVADVDPPVFSYCPDTLLVPSDPGSCGAVVVYTPPVVADNCIATLSAPPAQLSGSYFPIGFTSVTYTAEDGATALSTCTFTVGVVDNEAPVIIGMPANISVPSDPANCGASIEWNEPTVNDNCTAILTGDHVSGTVFPIGTSVVTYSATDGTRNVDASFLVTVTDTEAPTITCPADDTLDADPITCSVTMPVYAASAADNCAVDFIWQSEGPVPGVDLDGGTPTYYAKWSAVDASGNTANCLQRIDVIDITAPTVSCPLYDYFEVYLDANCQATFPDLRDSVTVSDCSAWTNIMWPPADTVFTTAGDVRMTMDINDAYGNHVDNDHWISIIDTIGPSIICPSDIDLSTDPNTCTANISVPGPIAITDNCGTPTWTSSMSDGAYGPGLYPVTLTATDGSTVASCSFMVSVLDTMIFCGGSDTLTADPGECGVNVTFAALDTISGVDLCGPITAWQSTHSNGWYAAPDTLSVTYAVTDVLGRTHDCNFSVTLLAAPVASITYGQTSFCDGPASTLPPTVDPVGGTFTSSTLAGAVGADGSIDLNHSNATPGVHIVEYTGPGSCGSTVSTSITIVAPANAGSDAALVVCSNTPSVSLFAQLAGTPVTGGTWSGPSPVVGGQYTPVTMAPGIYNYTVSAFAPCDAGSANITVTEFVQPTAAISYPGTPYCKDAGTANVTLVGTSGGTYSSAAGLSLNASTGAVTLATCAPGTYTVTYTLPPANGCSGITATASIRVTEPSIAAVGYDAATYCKSITSVNVAAVGNRPGTYSAVPAGLSINSATGKLNPSLSTAGTYTVTFTIAASDGCSQKTATTSVTIVSPPNAGENSTLAVCSNGNATSLLALMGGSPATSGSWSGPSIVTSHIYDPPSMNPGVYTYTVTGASPCVNATATVTVTENAAPSAGTNGTFTICSNGATQSLFAQLGGSPNTGGSWSGPSAVAGGNYDPATMSPGVYTYTVTGSSPCSNATASVTVSETAMPSATISYPGSTFCTSGSLVNAGLTGTGGGTFSASPGLASLNASNGTFNAGSTPANSYTITYTVGAGNACPQFQTSTAITVNQAPWAGSNGSASACTNGAPFQLFPNLTSSPATGGNWYKPFAGYAQIPGGTVDPAYYTTGGTYQYIYVVTGPPSCANDTAAVTVTYQPPPKAGTSTTATVCSNNAAFNLFNELGGTPATGGTWAFGAVSCSAVFTPGSSSAGVYTYTVAGTGPCASSSATVTVTVVAAPNAGTHASLSICGAAPAQDLFTLLGGTAQSGGSWAGASAVTNGLYDPATMVPGNYAYTVTGSSPCTNTSATVVVSEQTATIQFMDADGDGLGDPSASITDCVAHAGYVVNNSDACPLLFGTIGSPCNDLNALTGNDHINAVCACEGQLIDCVGIAGGTSLPGTLCNDNNSLTENDVWSVGCQCVGTLIPFDCAGIAHGTASVDACGVCSSGTTGLFANASCTDCAGVVNGSNVLGSSCNDGNASTENDTWNAGCQCAGTQINFDCAGVASGTAAVDACGVCTGGTTGLIANASCTDCAGVVNGTASVDACGVCSGGTTGLIANASCTDCAGVTNGTATADACGICSGGTTGLIANASCTDCAGVVNGTASVDACGVCSGGTTGLIPNSSCTDCAGVINGTAAVDACGICSGGTTGLIANASCTDCAGAVNGTAAVDACGTCSSGTTGLVANASCTDCAGVVNGTASVDACGICSGGTTGLAADASCTDCAGVVNGTATVDACGVCTGGTTGFIANASCTDCMGVVNGTNVLGSSCNDGNASTENDTWTAGCQCAGTPINFDCAGVANGSASIDACGTCSGGTTGVIVNASCTDCAGVVNGTATVDACGVCSGGTTGLIANTTCTDCAGVVNGTATVDACGVCTGGTTGFIANTTCTDCVGVVNGTASVDACGVCSGGTTGLIPNSSCTDCAGVINGTATVDACGICSGGTTGLIANASCTDCAGAVNGTAAVDACGTCSGGTTGLVANASCTDCMGVINGTNVLGSSCNDGNANTENDTWTAGCQCAGIPINFDCAGVANGTASIDACGVCAGGSTGLVANTSCTDCVGVVNGTASVDACGICSGGTTGLIANTTCTDCAGVINGTNVLGSSCNDGNASTENDTWTAGCQCAGTPINFDCAGVANGTASIDACGVCAGGSTGLVANASCTDCAGVVNGTASVDACGMCTGGTTGLIANTTCTDCAGVVNGTATVDACGACTGGTTGFIANASCADCAGVVNGTASVDACGTCSGGTTGLIANVSCTDCAGVVNGTASIDACGTCSGGTTGLIANASCTDCTGVVNGTNILGASCNDGNINTTNDTWSTGCQCIGTPIGFDCAGVASGSASIDACGTCSGGTTGLIVNAACTDCAGEINGTASVDACGTCSGGTTGLIANASCTDCAGVVNGTNILGSSCNDGNANTENDTWTAGCQCTGTPINFDCAGVANGTASIDDCGVCAGGSTGLIANASCTDCAGVVNGTATLDACGACSGGTTGLVANAACTDCMGVVNGTDILGSSCNDGNANTTNDTWNTGCQCIGTPIGFDCAGVANGTANIDACGTCSGGTTGLIVNAACTDCAGVINGTASVDACGTCSGGTTGFIVNASCTDCAGVVNGTATVDACGVCSGGTTGLIANTTCTDCAGVVNGTATVDACGVCSGGTTGLIADASCTDCMGVVNGTAAIDACGICSGGTTGLVANASCTDCAGVVNGTNVLGSSCDDGNANTENDTWGVNCQCSGTPINPDCLGVSGGSALPGTPCDDGNASTTGDVWSANCACAGSAVTCSSDAGPDRNTCWTTLTLSAIGEGSWSGPSVISFSNATDPNTTVTCVVPGIYDLIWTVPTTGCTASDTCRVIFQDPGTPIQLDAGADQHLELAVTTHLQAEASADVRIHWTLFEGAGTLTEPRHLGTDVEGLGLGRNVFLIHAIMGECQAEWDTVVVYVGDLFIPQGFSPNGDGDNDRFQITGIAVYPQSDLVVFNRWGQKVYESGAYANEWDGRSKNGEELPNDTYFYVLNLSAELTYNGFVVIKR